MAKGQSKIAFEIVFCTSQGRQKKYYFVQLNGKDLEVGSRFYLIDDLPCKCPYANSSVTLALSKGLPF